MTSPSQRLAANDPRTRHPRRLCCPGGHQHGRRTGEEEVVESCQLLGQPQLNAASNLFREDVCMPT